MRINFQDYRVTLIVTATDLRCGCSRLCAIAQEKLNINVYRGEDIVVFISKSSAICKLVCADAKGTSMLTRTLHAGRFEKMLVKRDEDGKINLTLKELESFLNGEKIFEKRSNFYPRKQNIKHSSLSFSGR
ncbi:IS66 family insertion sequence element accessory protein TnpB [Turicimonas muris]|uniref:Uncharacterized protein n=2 Tax=Turicimonas muris TaxID=1796652 RepID=A0A227KRL6_9BURK|nr:IS66 family insertion sequence element accessory protein TnpB [Turicimonas muris]ANU65335.1 hypothetical protein A4V04_02040 [Burkholderiales bacterium YL45]OXE51140.1 hypothetical protein ADH67_02280 [Turicimonas muris]QQQ96490.1 IS66 family insertion sequence element accessory protein TnpB [Turicimonas muris]